MGRSARRALADDSRLTIAVLPRAIFRGGMCRRLIATSLVLARPALPQSPLPPNEDGYDLWLRYRLVSNAARLAEYRAAARSLVIDSDSPTLAAARDELTRGLEGLLGRRLAIAKTLTDGSILVGSRTRPGLVASLPLARELPRLGDEGYLVRATTVHGKRVIVVTGNTDAGALYGAFRLLRQLQTNGSLARLAITDRPRIALRLLDHWDNLDRTVERGYAGKSLWEWDVLPDSMSPRYRDYARANASLGINGTVLNNVNANAKVLTPEYLVKVAALASVFRPYGIRVYLTARFSAPIEIGGLKTADPLDSAVRAWWKAKADEIYRYVPDFGGFVVKANSEGQPGPQDYKRSHADGANMLADAVAAHGGVVMWRAFVYSNAVPVDRVKQAYDEFKPLDGSFRANVLVQVKNGPLDFQPREPFHPLFGAMPKTPLVMEFQITKEYLGQDTHLVYLGSLFEEVLRSDTYAKGKGSTVARVIDGLLHGYRHTGIAGVSNIGTDRDWTGSQFNQANWYAFGRLAWDPTASSRAIADDWIRMTFSNDRRVVSRIEHMMLVSHEAVVNYMTPLGLAHIMATAHHYGPGPWADGGRPDWTPSYYHRADTLGLGFDRTSSGSNAAAQYFPPVRDVFASRDSVPENLLLWFHRVRWDDRLRSGRTLWEELVRHYTAGVDTVRSMERTWKDLRGSIDAERFAAVDSFLVIQEHEARWWRDAALSYFQTFSRRPIPPGYEPSLHPLSFYEGLRCPANRDKPRCPEIYK
ncbi:MAG TPA: alpha-glucuronidase family glycosyl hydrolase [Gemmatimonadaceae bacterium]|nr:alpha-glucuronidase family glycosyl hydrolase [Gemmatimonadaceae bacterium]